MTFIFTLQILITVMQKYKKYILFKNLNSNVHLQVYVILVLIFINFILLFI